MGIGVLGPVEVDGSGVGLGVRDRAVLAALAVRPGEALSQEQLADAVWGDDPPATWSKGVQGCISRLRKRLGPEAIQSSGFGYRLVAGTHGVDAQVFAELVGRVRELLAQGEPERAAYVAGQAMAMWRGSPFAELEEWQPAVVEAGRLCELRLEVEELHLEAALLAGHHDTVLAQARAMVDAEPLRERRWVLLARAQYRAGQQADALETVRSLRTVLAEELGLDPGVEVVELEQSILRQDPTLLVPAAIPGATEKCPYLGLTPYAETDADAFFGRDADIRSCLARIHRSGFLAVVGPSGCGKSSLVRAGVAVALRREGRDVVVVTPGPHPLDVLTALSDQSQAALVVDQAEEALALCEDPDERARFLAAVAEHAAVAPVVVALRADRMGDLAAYPSFAQVVEQGLYLLGAMTTSELRAAVEGPARQAGLVVQPGLVDLMVGEVEGEPGALPLMSHALRETWLRREGRTLTVAGYQESGGIRGAVAQSAEDVYRRLDPDQRRLLRDLLLRLVTPGVEGAPVRTRVPRRQVIVNLHQDQLVDLLVGSRLVTSHDGLIELAHEALTRAWPRLRGWLDDDLEGQRILHHLSASADAWDQLGRPNSELYRGVRLAQAVQWRRSATPDLTRVERDFLEASTNAEDDERAAAERQVREQVRMIRRLRVALVGAAGILIAALVAGFLAVRQGDAAQRNAAAALAARTGADARAAGARALVTDDIDTSLLTAVAGVRLDDSPETRSSLLAALGKHPELVGSTPLGGAGVMRFDVSPDGRTVAAYDQEHRLHLVGIRTGELRAEYQAGSDDRLSWLSGNVAFSPDGSSLAVVMTAPTRHPVELLDADTLQPLATQPGGTRRWRWRDEDLLYSGDGRFLAAVVRRVQGRGEATRATSTWALVWRTGDLRRPAHRVRLEETARIAISPHGRVLFTAQPLARYDLRAGTSQHLPDPFHVEQLALSPDGSVLAGSAGVGSLLLDPNTGEVQRRLSANGEGTFMAHFSDDGRLVGSVAPEKQEAFVWNVATGRVRARVSLADTVDPVRFSPDGSTLYTAGSDAVLRAWDLSQRRRFIPRVAERGSFPEYEFRVLPAPGGRYVAYPFAGGVRFLDVEHRSMGPALDGPSGVTRREGTWAPDGVHYAVEAGDRVTVWDARTGEVISRARQPGVVAALDFSTDGSALAVADARGAWLVDAETLRPIGSPVDPGGVPCAVALGPDNRTALVATGPRESTWPFWASRCPDWVLVDLASGDVLHRGAVGVGQGIGRMDFSPAGDTAALALATGEVLELDVGTGSPSYPPVDAHDGFILSVRYSPDGSQLVTSDTDASAAVWDSGTGLLRTRVVAPTLYSVSEFSSDGSVLLADPYRGAVYRWDTRPAYAVDFACRLAGRDLTRSEWTDQFGERPFRTTCPA